MVFPVDFKPKLWIWSAPCMLCPTMTNFPWWSSQVKRAIFVTLKTLALGSTKLVNLFIFFIAYPSGLTLWIELVLQTSCQHKKRFSCILHLLFLRLTEPMHCCFHQSNCQCSLCNSLHCSFCIPMNIAWKHISHIYVEASIWVFLTIFILLELEMYISGACTEKHPAHHFRVSLTLTLFNYLKRPKPFWGLGPKHVDFCCKCWHLNKGFKDLLTFFFFAHFWKRSQGLPI